MHVARRMVFREIQLGEIVVVGLDVRPFGDGEAHVGEDRGQFVGHLRDRMDAADLGRRFAHRQGDVDALGVEAGFQRRVLERLAAGGERRVDAILQPVDQRPLGLALFRRQRAERLQQRGEGAALAQRRDAHCFERRVVAGGGDIGENLLLELRGVGHGAQSGRNGRSVSPGRPPAWVSIECTWPR